MISLLKREKYLCTPAFIYLIISLIGLIIAGFQNIKNNNIYTLLGISKPVSSTFLVFVVKIIYILFWSWILNLICADGHKGIAWILILIPFILFFIIFFLVKNPYVEPYTIISGGRSSLKETPVFVPPPAPVPAPVPSPASAYIAMQQQKAAAYIAMQQQQAAAYTAMEQQKAAVYTAMQKQQVAAYNAIQQQQAAAYTAMQQQKAAAFVAMERQKENLRRMQYNAVAGRFGKPQLPYL